MIEPKIFICYRREDSLHYACRLEESLQRAFPDGQVFRDSSSISIGTKYPSEIRKQLKQSTTLIVVVGPRWEEIRARNGSASDWVHEEVSHSIQKKLHVIPLMVGNSQPPKSKSIPTWVTQLFKFQAHRMDDDNWARDLPRLVEAIRTPVKGSPLHRMHVEANDKYVAALLRSLGKRPLGIALEDSSQDTIESRSIRLARRIRNLLSDFLGDLPIEILKDMCIRVKLPRTGTKQVLVSRLVAGRPFPNIARE